MVSGVEGSPGRGPLTVRLSRPGDLGARSPSLSGDFSLSVPLSVPPKFQPREVKNH